MSQERDDSQWLKRGKQRTAVARVLRKPMIGTEICVAARVINPHIQLRDVWFLLRQMQERGLVPCINPRLVTGRLYGLTARGRDAVYKAFGLSIPIPPSHLVWRKYSWVVRAKIRRLTLLTLGQLEAKTGTAQTPTHVRKQLCVEHPVGLNPVLRAVRELADKKLIACVGVTKLRN